MDLDRGTTLTMNMNFNDQIVQIRTPRTKLRAIPNRNGSKCISALNLLSNASL